MKDENCIFCKLAGGDIPTATVYEDEYLRAIMDAAPANKGHIIILPKTHASSIYELDEEYVSRAFVLAKKLASALKKLLNCDGVNILQNNEEAAGQTVFHLHVHVIPRFNKDNCTLVWKPTSYEEGESVKIAKDISELL